jgi:folate-binding protein YgfZ
MSYTLLQEALRARPADPQPLATVDYRGATMAARFSDRQTEFGALQNGCAVYELGFRGRLSLTGSDRLRWLNGMVTNNIRDLAAGRGVYAFLLNPQGHILGDMFVFNEGETLLVETDRSQVEKIVATFDHYIIMDDVVVTNISEQRTALGVAGPESRALLIAARMQVPELQLLQAVTLKCDCDCGCVECTIVRGEDAAYESYEIWLDPKDVYNLWRVLLKAGATAVGCEALEMQRIVNGIPLYGADIRERDLPQETEQMRALSFSKGCYVGQEIVERIRSRGSVHRKFTAFLIEGEAAIASGTKIIAGEKEVGEITSSALVPTSNGERIVALGYIRRELGVPERELVIGNANAKVVHLPIQSIALENSEHVAQKV